METVYANIAKRTGGNIYIGVVGPVRTGKSTLIKRIMETLVIPNINDHHRAERAKDELPQSGSGKTIMTSEPKFIPEEAVEIYPDGKTCLRIRMIDSVGYMVKGAVGAVEDGVERMVTTPWFDYEIPMTQAAELGTKKVMEEHCSIGLVVTTDGSVTDIPRSDYEDAEAAAIRDMQATGKPFLVVINSREPNSPSAAATKEMICQKFGIDAVIADCQALDLESICSLLERFLYCFPMQQLHVYWPGWLNALDSDHPVKSAVYAALLRYAEKAQTLGQAKAVLNLLTENEQITAASLRNIDPATGIVSCNLAFPESLFYDILSEKAGIQIQDAGQLMTMFVELTGIKEDYDRISDALSSARATGYGIVMPAADEMTLETPQIVRKGGAFGVKLKAGAPSIHMIRVDINTEISPMVGGEQQSQELIEYLSDEDPEKLWQSNIFGKSVYTLIREGLTTKLVQTPEDVRAKFRGTLTRIVNDGASGLICFIL